MRVTIDMLERHLAECLMTGMVVIEYAKEDGTRVAVPAVSLTVHPQGKAIVISAYSQVFPQERNGERLMGLPGGPLTLEYPAKPAQ